MRAFPNIEIITPCDEISTKKVASLCVDDPKFRFIRLDREALPPIYGQIDINLDDGFSTILKGKDKCVITCGKLLHVAKSTIEKNNLDLGLIDLFKIKPLTKNFLNTISQYSEIITLEEQCLDGGFGSAILEHCNTNSADINLKRHGLDARFYFENGGRVHLMNKYGLDIDKILSKY